MMKKKLLIVVDYQNDFVSGSLGFPKAAELEGRIAAKIRAYRQNGDEVAFTLDTHGEDYLRTQEGRLLPVGHCIRGTGGWELYGETAALKEDGDAVFIKDRFGSPKLFEYLAAREYAGVELVGVVTNICVIANAVLAKTALPETPVTVDASCCAGNDGALHEKALDVMESLQIHVTNRQ